MKKIFLKFKLCIMVLFVILIISSCKMQMNELENSNNTIETTESKVIENTIENTENTEIDEELKKEIDYWTSQPLEISLDGSTCYVLDYFGGELSVEKYGSFKKLDFSKNKAKSIKNMKSMFGWADDDDWDKDFKNLEEVNLTGLNTSECITMERLFDNCTSLKVVDFGNINTSNVKNMYKMFNCCYSLEKIINYENLDVSNVENMRGMFFQASNIKNINLSKWDTKNVKDMSFMFYGSGFENIILNGLNTENVKDMSYMFGKCKNVVNYDFSTFNTKNVISMSHMFYYDDLVEKIDLSSFDVSNCYSMDYMFYNCTNLKYLNLNSLAGNKIDDMSYMFYFCKELTDIDLSNMTNEKNLVNCSYMFRYCEKLQNLDMSKMNLSKIYGIYIFDGCHKLRNYQFDYNTLSLTEKIIEENYMPDQIDKKLLEHVYGENYSVLFNNNEIIKKQIDDLAFNNELGLYSDKKSEIVNRDMMFMENETWLKLLKNDFLVKKEDEYMEFFNYYEEARYNHFPNFVTSDSLLHTYHLYFDYLMKKIESTTLLTKVEKMTKNMLDISKYQYEVLKNTKFENYAKTLVAYFSVPLSIIDYDFKQEEYVKDIVEEENRLINECSNVGAHPIFKEYYNENDEYFKKSPENYIALFNEDYTQYKPRGHYSESEELTKYFKVLMWYGRTNFSAYKDDFVAMAMMMSLYAKNNEILYNDYLNVKNIIYTFTGNSDDVSVEEFSKCIEKIYGSNSIQNSIYENTDKFSNFCSEVKKLRVSNINSLPGTYSFDQNVNFRFIGQSYTLDEEIFMNLMYAEIDKNKKGEKRYLPDFLDVPASLNSETAYNILKKENRTDFPNYDNNVNKLRKSMIDKVLNNNNSIYAKWMKCLYQLIADENNNQYPQFMKSDEWKKKSLETFGGSYAELKHDTILYTKDAFGASECGEGGGVEFYDTDPYEIDNKGYVEPRTTFYAEMYTMSKDLYELFNTLNLLDDNDKEFLNNFITLANNLIVISNKELNNEKLTDDEYALIEGYGATIEHLIIDSGAYKWNKYADYSPQPSSAIVADIASGDRSIGDFVSLEIATGNPIRIYVLVNVNGKYKICQGAAFDFYQFEVPIEKRMTDIEWRTAMGFDAGYSKDSNGNIVFVDKNLEDWGVEYDNQDELVEIKKEDFGIDFKFQDWTNSYKQLTNSISEKINTYYIDHCDSYRRKNICSVYQED